MAGAVEPEPNTSLTAILGARGFAFVGGGETCQKLEGLCRGALAKWPEFAASWDDLVFDTYLAEHGRFRRRRYAAYRVPRAGAAVRLPPQPHFQSLLYNRLQGDIERWFEPMSASAGDSPVLHAVFAFMREIFGPLAPSAHAWHAEVHQFRIEAKPGEPGQPTPEGVHRDGVDFVLVLLVRRENIVSGTTTVHAIDGTVLGEFTLTEPFDTALLVDDRVAHGVTPVLPKDPASDAHRDVLVVTLRAEN